MAVVNTEQSSVDSLNRQTMWHSDAPRELVESCAADDPIAAWPIWQNYLRMRKKPFAPPFFAKKKPPLLWGWPQQWERKSTKNAIESPSALAEIILGDDRSAVPDLPRSLQMVALAYTLPALSRELPPETWWHLLEKLGDVAAEMKAHRVAWPAEPHDVVRHQLLAGELPLALGYLFPELAASPALRADARACLSEAIIELTDGRGLPDARLLSVLGPLFACWTRARWLGANLKSGPWSPDAELQYQWLVRQAIRLADKGGRFLLAQSAQDGIVEPQPHANAHAGKAWNKKVFKMAIELAGDPGDRAAAAVALPRGVVSKNLRHDAADLPRPSLNSDWAGITIMADGWSQSDTRLAVAYAGKPMSIDLSVNGEKLLSGRWTFETACDGKPVQSAGDWVQLCWERGKQFDLLELGQELTDGLRLERQILFARDDRVLYLADSIISRDPGTRTIQHSFALPLAADACWQPELETRDGVLVHRKVRAAVLPLALREWRSDPRGGTLEDRHDRLVLRQEISGRALCCPLMLDLDRKRAKKQRTWRQLTVGESLQVVPSDAAVGFRAQSGSDQWLFYRALGITGNRTVLGQNFAGEFCAGRFLTTGELREWIEIEAV